MPKRSEKKKRKNTIKILEVRHRKRKFEGSSKLERVKSGKFFFFSFFLVSSGRFTEIQFGIVPKWSVF